MHKSLLVLAALLSFGSTVCAQEPTLNNKSFSYFGVGNEYISYEENATIGGNRVDLSVDFSNPVQRSGGYIPLFRDHGLYLLASSTLKPITAGESWEYQGIGTIQTNDSKFAYNELSVTPVYHVKPGHHLTAGMDYYSIKFTRFNFRTAEGTDAFNRIYAPGGETYGEWIGRGQEGRAYPGLRPENNLNTVIEDFSCLTAMVGYRYDSFFADADHRWRFSGGVRAGVPLYYSVENSQLPGTDFTGSVDKGYDLEADAAVARKFSEHFSAMAGVNFKYKHREKVASGNSIIPENTLKSVHSTLALVWAF